MQISLWKYVKIFPCITEDRDPLFDQIFGAESGRKVFSSSNSEMRCRSREGQLDTKKIAPIKNLTIFRNFQIM